MFAFRLCVRRKIIGENRAVNFYDRTETNKKIVPYFGARREFIVIRLAVCVRICFVYIFHRQVTVIASRADGSCCCCCSNKTYSHFPRHSGVHASPLNIRVPRLMQNSMIQITTHPHEIRSDFPLMCSQLTHAHPIDLHKVGKITFV